MLQFPNNIVFLSLKVIFVLVNSVDSDEKCFMQHFIWSSLFAKVHIKESLVYKGLKQRFRKLR